MNMNYADAIAAIVAGKTMTRPDPLSPKRYWFVPGSGPHFLSCDKHGMVEEWRATDADTAATDYAEYVAPPAPLPIDLKSHQRPQSNFKR
jgi:hypothetical protein